MARKFMGADAAGLNDLCDVGDLLNLLHGVKSLQANRYYTPALLPAAGAVSAAWTLNQQRMAPFMMLRTGPFKGIASRITTAGAAASTFDVYIYASDATGAPTGSPIAQCTGMSAASTGVVYKAFDSGTTFTFPKPGVYWLLYSCSVASAVFVSMPTYYLIGHMLGLDNGSNPVIISTGGMAASVSYTYGLGSAPTNPAPTYASSATVWCPLPIFQT